MNLITRKSWIVSGITIFFVVAVAAADHGWKKEKGDYDWDYGACEEEEASLPVQLGPRPSYLVSKMDDCPLKKKLWKTVKDRESYKTSDFSIGHRGAPLQFPEHTQESYLAASIMGAGILECDVAFTNDSELVCRHSQCDLHTTTDILLRPELAEKCSEPFSPGEFDSVNW